ncbi:DNA polymerase subunit Cdc27 [Roridomyces roridus]|uniref:DNA polymerase delta subunit 3 n=1 Tax=Roridomyces roridus TaxID=1738132 RepID=A0AAD7BKI1_9AGAR|nr:DNA polymerase subunit Cdc27 [Roridomyces roridus]
MSSQDVRDYLTKQLLIENNIVTYRSLSRALGLNVNVAKNELAEFHASEGQKMAATYLLSGSIRPEPTDPFSVDEDDDMYDDDEEEEDVVECTQVLLVGEKDVESAQAQFVRLEAMHVYSLSPSVIRDKGLLCTPTDIVRAVDNGKKGKEMEKTVGRIVAANVVFSDKPFVNSLRPGRTASTSAQTKTADTSKSTKEKEETAKPKETKPKQTGKLDFFAKPKPKVEAKPKEEEKTKPKAEVKPKEKPKTVEKLKVEEGSSINAAKKSTGKSKSALASDSEDDDVKPKAGPSTISEKVDAKMADAESSKGKRGVKRKSTAALVDSEEEEEEPKPKPVQSKSEVRVRKGVVLSDSDEDVPAPKPKAKGKAKETEAEKELREMMDIDDDGVERASRFVPHGDDDVDMDDATGPSAPASVPASDVEADMSDPDPAPKRAPVKRKPKKVVPIGRNGLKKRRVVKSKTTLDAKGYMVTEDVSEYESVDEEEAEEEKKGKGKSKAPAKAKGKGKEKAKDDTEEEQTKEKPVKEKPAKEKAPAKEKEKSKPAPAAKPKLKPSGKSGQASVADFFGRKK